VDWDISVTKKGKSPGQIAKSLIGKTDLVAVYGGDGCVTSVAAALHGTKLPIAIIPAGTANVMAKELAIPTGTVAALQILQKGKHKIKAVDVGLVNGKPFILRINLGIMANMVIEAGRTLKDNIGQLAYGVSAVKTVAEAEPINYRLNIDGKKIAVSGVALTVTNSGRIGIGDFDLQPGISITDGLLDVILMQNNDLLSVIKVASSALLQNESAVLQHWTGKKITITMDKKQSFIRDDKEVIAKKLKIEVVPRSVKFIVPC